MENYQNNIPFTAGDVLTQEAVIWLQELVTAHNAQKAQIAALESRIAALEP